MLPIHWTMFPEQLNERRQALLLEPIHAICAATAPSEVHSHSRRAPDNDRFEVLNM